MRKENKRTYAVLLAVLLAGKLLVLPGHAQEQEVFLQPDTWVPTAGVTLDAQAPEDGIFRFRLLDEEGNLLAETENEGQSAAFPPFSYAEPGVWVYYLKEVCEEVWQDRAVYTAVVEVTGQESLSVQVTWLRNGQPYTGIPQFVNRMGGENPQTGDNFRACLTTLTLSAASLALVWKRQKCWSFKR